MQDLTGKTAFVTGGASGIGLALGRAFLEAGMRVMLADIEPEPLTAAVDSLRKLGDVKGVACDVADMASVARAAQAAFAAFGKVHVLCNNAGVAGGGGIDDISVETWRWVLDVNVMGIVHGIKAFLPHIRAHGEGGHIVNTASMAGMTCSYFNPYNTSKYAAVAMSEGLAPRLAQLGIGISVLCPSFVRTQIAESQRNRQPHYGEKQIPDPASPAGQLTAWLAEQAQKGIEPDKVAADVLTAIRQNRLYIFTHPETRSDVEARFAAIMAAFDEAQAG
jgi:NAD(P)-dependent dehydrogenase (short-subunit alcohol dehydrogenase family)